MKIAGMSISLIEYAEAGMTVPCRSETDRWLYQDCEGKSRMMLQGPRFIIQPLTSLR